MERGCMDHKPPVGFAVENKGMDRHGVKSLLPRQRLERMAKVDPKDRRGNVGYEMDQTIRSVLPFYFDDIPSFRRMLFLVSSYV